MIVQISLLSLMACAFVIAVPPSVTKCKLDNWKCITASAKDFISVFAKGNPEWGVETLDPFYMKSLDASSPQLKLLLKDITGMGLKDCLVKKIEFDQARSKLLVKLECSVDFKGQYEIDGSVIFLPIRGKGQAHVILRKVALSAEADVVEVTGKDGLPHWSIKRYSHSYELHDKATIELENLFEGNELLGYAVKELFESSSNEVIREVGPPIIRAVVDKIVVVIKHFFKKVPLQYLIEY